MDKKINTPGNTEFQLGPNTPGNAEPQLGLNTPGNAEPQLGSTEWYSRGYLPHRDKVSLLQTITFRLADSLPQNVLAKLGNELLRIPKEKQDLQKRKNIEKWLDAGMGCCALNHPKMANIMQETLLKFDGYKYRLIAWCIMPNHVHVLIEPHITLGKIVQSWKSYTGRWALTHSFELGLGNPGNINANNTDAKLELGVPRIFWMREYWDRFIRDEKHLYNVIEYIHNNPVKANLCKKPEAWDWSSA